MKVNKGAGGIDGMKVDGLLPYLREHQTEIVEQVRGGKYKPNLVRRVEIPKEEKGKFRKLGVPTVVYRVIQQAIAQELIPIYKEQFSDNSFGFRPDRSAHDALRRCREHINDINSVDKRLVNLEKGFGQFCPLFVLTENDRIIQNILV